MIIKRGDTQGWVTTLTSQSPADDLADVDSVLIYMRDRRTGGVVIEGAACAVSERSTSSMQVLYLPAPEAVATPGRYDVLWEAQFVDGRVATWPSSGYDEVIIEDDFTTAA